MPHVEQSVVCKRSNSEIIADYASTIVYEGGPNPVWICDEMCLYDMNFAFAFCFFLSSYFVAENNDLYGSTT